MFNIHVKNFTFVTLKQLTHLLKLIQLYYKCSYRLIISQIVRPKQPAEKGYKIEAIMCFCWLNQSIRNSKTNYSKRGVFSTKNGYIVPI